MTTQINVLPLLTIAVSASQDGDLIVPIGYKGSDSKPIDLTGISVDLDLYAYPVLSGAGIAFDCGAYLSNSGVNGTISLVVPQTTWATVPAGVYLGDLVATADGETIVIANLKIGQSRIGGCQITSWRSTARNKATASVSGYIPGPPGPPGLKGDKGDIGQQGLPGTPAPLPVSFTLTSVSSYAASHGYAYVPRVSLLTTTGEEVETNVSHSPGQVVLSFPVPFTGSLTLA